MSFNLAGDARCVDIFGRPDGSFGFDEYRRDPEDPKGWYQTGFFDEEKFSTQQEALDAAKRSVTWLHATIDESQ